MNDTLSSNINSVVIMETTSCTDNISIAIFESSPFLQRFINGAHEILCEFIHIQTDHISVPFSAMRQLTPQHIEFTRKAV